MDCFYKGEQLDTFGWVGRRRFMLSFYSRTTKELLHHRLGFANNDTEACELAVLWVKHMIKDEDCALFTGWRKEEICMKIQNMEWLGCGRIASETKAAPKST